MMILVSIHPPGKFTTYFNARVVIQKNQVDLNRAKVESLWAVADTGF